MNTGFIRSVCFVALLLFVTGAKVSALQIIYPADGTFVTKSNYLIIKGGQDPFLDGVAVEINGVKSDVLDLTGEKYRAVFADMLLLEPDFDPGENRIIVEGYVNGSEFAEAIATIYYQDDLMKSAPKGYRKEVFHVAEREAPCVGCHNMQPSELQLSDPRITTNPCASCHKRMLNQDHVHGPAGVFDCVYCHDANSRPVRYLAREGDALVCRECHADKVQGFEAQKFIHGPLEAGMCLACHDPHASSHPAQLVLGVNELCLNCHSTVKDAPHVTSGAADSHPLEGPVNPMNDRKLFNCSSCHDPHGGAAPQYFVDAVTGRMQLCAKCHRK